MTSVYFLKGTPTMCKRDHSPEELQLIDAMGKELARQSAPVMTDEEFARFVGPHPLRVGDRIMRPKLRRLRFRRDNYEAREVGRHPGVVVSMEADGFIVRWLNTGVRRWFRFADEGRLWIRARPPRVSPSPSPWVPPRRVLGCCGDRQYEGASHACTERTCTHLPVLGQTCADCVHVEKCTTMFGQEPTDTTCQFFPRRFRSSTATVDGARLQRTG